MHITVNGARLFFDVVGSKLAPEGPAMREKPTLILLTGSPLDHSIFRPALDRLGDVAQVIYLDYRGNGHSDRGGALDWDRAQIAEDVFGFCQALGIERPFVLGYSMGARVAVAFAAAHPEHIAGLIVQSGTANGDRSASFDAFERLGGPEVRAAAVANYMAPSEAARAEFVRLCYPYFVRRAPVNPERLARMRADPAFWAHFAAAGGPADIRPMLATIQCPTLVLVGEDDPVTPPVQAEMVHAALPAGRSRLVRFARCGHGLHMEDTEQYLELLRAFLAET